MKQCLFNKRMKVAMVSGVALALGVVSASSATASDMPHSIDTTKCVKDKLSQPFLSIGDQHWYSLAPGQTVGSFHGDGWTLSGGASVAPATIADDADGSVLDLPAGARAVTPEICVQRDFKSARAMIRNVAGSGGVRISVSYAGTKWETRAKDSGRFHGHKTHWTVSRRLNVKPSHRPGWQLAKFTFKAEGQDSEFQIYDFWVDPRMK
jgi:hypothetical protein